MTAADLGKKEWNHCLREKAIVPTVVVGGFPTKLQHVPVVQPVIAQKATLSGSRSLFELILRALDVFLLDGRCYC